MMVSVHHMIRRFQKLIFLRNQNTGLHLIITNYIQRIAKLRRLSDSEQPLSDGSLQFTGNALGCARRMALTDDVLEDIRILTGSSSSYVGSVAPCSKRKCISSESLDCHTYNSFSEFETLEEHFKANEILSEEQAESHLKKMLYQTVQRSML